MGKPASISNVTFTPAISPMLSSFTVNGFVSDGVPSPTQINGYVYPENTNTNPVTNGTGSTTVSPNTNFMISFSNVGGAGTGTVTYTLELNVMAGTTQVSSYSQDITIQYGMVGGVGTGGSGH
jgi:hypothetical protein